MGKRPQKLVSQDRSNQTGLVIIECENYKARLSGPDVFAYSVDEEEATSQEREEAVC